jgi:hypothetical protein
VGSVATGAAVSARSADGRSARRRASAPYAARKAAPRPPDHRDGSRSAVQQGAGPGHAGGDEDDVGQGADGHDHHDVLAAQALAEHEGVLRTDRHDEGQAQAETGHGGEQSGRHGPRMRPAGPEAQRDVLLHP